jgi:nucleoside-diphosphate-sugar epimerase
VKRVAVTGASGFIGTHLVQTLTARGDDVVRIARPFDRKTLAPQFAGLEAVVHLAGVVSTPRPDEFFTGNVEATRVVAAAAADAGTRLVHISSLAAAGPAPPTAPRTESDPPTPINDYGRSKLEGERVVAATSGLRWIILRPGVVYGPGDRALRPLFTYARRRVIPLVGSSTAAYTFIYIDDVVRAILAAVDRGIDGDTIFLGHARPVSPAELIETIRLLAHSKATIVRIPRIIVRAAAEVGEWLGLARGKPAPINRRRFVELYSAGFACRVERMEDRLGVVAAVGLQEGLSRAAAWYLAPNP